MYVPDSCSSASVKVDLKVDFLQTSKSFYIFIFHGGLQAERPGVINYLKQKEKQTLPLYTKQLLGMSNVFSTRSLLITRKLNYRVSVVTAGWCPDDEMYWLANVKQTQVAVASTLVDKCN